MHDERRRRDGRLQCCMCLRATARLHVVGPFATLSLIVFEAVAIPSIRRTVRTALPGAMTFRGQVGMRSRSALALH